MYLMMLRFLRILSRYFARDRFYLAQLEENPQCKYCFRRRLSPRRAEVRSWIFMPVMTRIIVVCARILKNSTQGTIPISLSLSLSMLAPSLHALGTDARARVTRWLIQQPSADWKTWLQSLRGTKVEETNRTSERARATRRIMRKEYWTCEWASVRRSKAIKMPSSAICFNINKLRSLIDFIPYDRKL